MSKYSSFTDLWEDVENDDAFWTEKNILDFTTKLYQFMQYRDVSKKELAERIGTSQAYITKVFRGDANFTIATMTKLARALDAKLDVQVVAKEERVQQWFKVLKINTKEQVVTSPWNKGILVEHSYSDSTDNGMEVCAG